MERLVAVESDSVTLGNIVGGFVFTGLALYLTYKPRPTPESSPLPVPTRVPAE
jgi:hypothetical protein